MERYLVRIHPTEWIVRNVYKARQLVTVVHQIFDHPPDGKELVNIWESQSWYFSSQKIDWCIAGRWFTDKIYRQDLIVIYQKNYPGVTVEIWWKNMVSSELSFINEDVIKHGGYNSNPLNYVIIPSFKKQKTIGWQLEMIFFFSDFLFIIFLHSFI